MADITNRAKKRQARHRRIRRRLSGTAECPRLAVFKSSKQIYVQAIDDHEGKTLVAASSMDKALRKDFEGKKPTEVAGQVGKAIAERCKDKGLTKVVFDRGGFPYKGRVKALADAAREAGLKF